MKKSLLISTIIFSVAFSAGGSAAERTAPGNATVYETTTSEVTTTTTAETSETVVQEPTIKPDLLQIRNICELATLKCSYNNVAKSTKEPGTGLSHLGEIKRTFWIEYSGTVDIGIDLTKVKMDLNEQTITITIPKAQILDIQLDTYNKDAYVISNDVINHNPISAEDQENAIQVSKEQLEESFANNTTLLNSAQSRAKELIETYINQVGNATNIKYNIVWEYE